MKTPRTKFQVKGDIPVWLLGALKKHYPKGLKLITVQSSVTTSFECQGSANPKPACDEEGEEALVDILQTDWFRNTKMSPGDMLRTYRENRGLAQEELARKLGGGTQKQHVSDMEHGRRGISKTMAKKLAELFSTSPSRFI